MITMFYNYYVRLQTFFLLLPGARSQFIFVSMQVANKERKKNTHLWTLKRNKRKQVGSPWDIFVSETVTLITDTLFP